MGKGYGRGVTAPPMFRNGVCWKTLYPHFYPYKYPKHDFTRLRMVMLTQGKFFYFQDFSELDYSAFYRRKHIPTNSNPSPAASKRSETNGFQTSFLVSDPLTVLGLLIDSAPHIGFHAVCAVLFHFFRDMAIYVVPVVPRSLLGTARKAAPPNGGAALRFLQPCGACCQRSSCCFIHTSMTRL